VSGAASFFAQSYAEARAGFLAAAEVADLPVQSHLHPLLGRDGEALAMDVVRDGPADADAVLLITSACHGVEGYCGSGVQRALLADTELRLQAHAAGVATLYLHALNPWGFSWWRRTTHDNVDLNRNFLDFHTPLAPNPVYDELASAIVPGHWPSPQADAQLRAYAAAHGFKALQAAISSGQHDHPQGLFFGGRAPTWSQQTLRQVLQAHGRRCTRLGWIDLHTGLGPSGHGEKIFAGRDDAAALARARAWWGAEVTSIYDGTSASARLSGLMWLAAEQECPQASYTGIALEYGTVPFDEVIQALRADQWLENHPEVGGAQRSAIKQRLRDVFYTDNDGWKSQIVEQARRAAKQALAGLG
jgi:hypothetical protein